MMLSTRFSIIFLLGICAVQPVQLKSISFKTISTVTVTGLSAIWLRNFYQIKKIEYMLEDSSLPSRAQNQKFRFSGWRLYQGYNDRYGSWLYSQDLSGNEKLVRKALKRDAKLSDRIYIYDEKKEIRINSQNISGKHIKNAMAQELAELDRTLEWLGKFSDVKQSVITFCKNTFNVQSHFGNEHKTVIGYVPHLAQCLEPEWDGLRKDVEQLGEIQSIVKSFIHAPLLYNPSLENILIWKLMPHYNRSAKLYIKVLQRYVRLYTLKTIADKMIWQAGQNGLFKKKFTRLQTDIQDMIHNHLNIAQAAIRTQQITHATNIQKDIEKILHRLNTLAVLNKEKIKNKLQQINTKLQTVSQSLQLHKPQADTVAENTLQEIQDLVHELLSFTK